jgi:hypothetical protein
VDPLPRLRRSRQGGGEAMKPSHARRHVWHENDYCVTCGVRRHGYQGGGSGSLTYAWPDGRVTFRAGECPGPAADKAVTR